MINLAGAPIEEANRQVTEELKAAGVEQLLEIVPHQREVKATVVGVLQTKQAYFGFRRAWYYWVVKATKPFPLAKILKFNAEWGETARIWGYAGGCDNQAVEKNHLDGEFSCLESWHIDTPEALQSFVAFAKECYEPESISLGGERTGSCRRRVEGSRGMKGP